MEVPGGNERPVTDLWTWMPEASPISEDEFNKRKKATSSDDHG